MKLTVKKAPRAAIGNDIVYISKHNRGSVDANKVCKITVADKSVFATVRGNKQRGQILIDQQQRLQLNVSLDQEYEFFIHHKWYYFLIAPLRATNTGIKASYLIACISLTIAVLSTVTSVVSFLL